MEGIGAPRGGRGGGSKRACVMCRLVVGGATDCKLGWFAPLRARMALDDSSWLSTRWTDILWVYWDANKWNNRRIVSRILSVQRNSILKYFRWWRMNIQIRSFKKVENIKERGFSHMNIFICRFCQARSICRPFNSVCTFNSFCKILVFFCHVIFGVINSFVVFCYRILSLIFLWTQANKII